MELQAVEGENLFSRIDPAGGMESVLQAACRIGTRLERLPAPKSLCEIETNEEDYAWLCAWAATVGPSDLRDIFGSGARLSSRTEARIDTMEAIGCLLLLLSAEVARREAREGQVWPSVLGRFNPAARRFLFNGRYPHPHFIEAIETALRRFSLRHVLGMEGIQSYYVSVYLQFGFTRRGIPMLPFWLTGHGQTAAVQYLLASPLSSPSFQLLWHSLREFRKDNVTEHHIRSIVENSPWTPPGATEELIRQARARRELGWGRGEGGHRDEEAAIRFLDERRLEWHHPSFPRFHTSLVNLAALDLEAPRYDVLIRDRAVASLIRQADGTYAHPERIDLPADSPALVAALVDERGESRTLQEVVLWDSHEDLGVALFDGTTGRRLDAWSERMDRNRSYVLMVDRTLRVDPAIRPWQHLNAERTLYRLDASWEPRLRILLDDEELWTPRLTGTSRRQEPDWARSIHLCCIPGSTVPLGQCIELSVQLGPVAVVDSIRVSGFPLSFEQRGTLATTEPFEVSPVLALAAQRGGLIVQLRVRRGNDSTLLVRRLALEIRGVARSADRGWEMVDPAEELTVREARRRLYHFFLSAEQREEMGLFEGALFLQRLRSRVLSLEQLPGCGGPLTVHKPYNLLSVEEVVPIAREVVDKGIVHQVGEHERGLSICLEHPISPSERYQVVYWDEQGCRITAGRDVQAQSDDRWWMGLGDPVPDQFVLGLAYEGTRIGGWWTESIGRLVRTNDGESAERAAALIRWMRLPIQKALWRQELTGFVQAFPAAVASAWLLGSGLTAALQHTSGSEWLAATQSLFDECFPELDQWEHFRSRFTEEEALCPLADVLCRISLLDPFLMGRLALLCLRHHGEIDLGIRPPEHQIHLARNRFLGLDAGAGEVEGRNRERQMLEDAADSMDLDPRFLDHVARKALGKVQGMPLSALESANLATALSVQAFRRYLSVKVLDEVLATI